MVLKEDPLPEVSVIMTMCSITYASYTSNYALHWCCSIICISMSHCLKIGVVLYSFHTQKPGRTWDFKLGTIPGLTQLQILFIPLKYPGLLAGSASV